MGFSVLFLGEERKLVKMYYDEESKKSYNVSIMIDRLNRIIGSEIYEIIQTGEQGASISRVQKTTPTIALQIDRDLSQMTL